MLPILFSMQGRINRSKFWLYGIGIGLISMVVAGILLAIFWAVIPGTIDADGGFHVEGLSAVPYVVVMVAYFVVIFWSGLCLGVKRYHDLDKSGAWLLINLIPGIGGLIYFIQAGCLRGTVGMNRYGADPLGAGI